jgi:hypothetical protein
MIYRSLVAAVAFAASASAAPAANVTRVDTGLSGTTTLLYSGPVRQGDLVRLQNEVAKVAPGQRIALMLESPGGLVSEGLAIGRYIHANKITTIAIAGPGCASACTQIFLAGRDFATGKPARIMISGAQVGFHQTSIRNNENSISSAAAAA